MRALNYGAPLLALVAALLLASCGGDERDSTQSVAAEQSGQERDGSLGAFGQVAQGEDEEAILAAEHGYLSALGERDLRAACSHLAKRTVASLLQVAPPELRAEGCAAILPKVLSGAAVASAKQQAQGEIVDVRLKAKQAFVTYRAPGARLYAFSLVREDGEWGVTTITGTVVIPEGT